VRYPAAVLTAGVLLAAAVLIGIPAAAQEGSTARDAADAGSSATRSTEKAWRNQEPIELDGVEVREYEGERLSLINRAFRENSIKGPQYVDKAGYELTIETPGLDLPGPDSPDAAVRNLSYDEVLDLDAYKKVVTLYCVEGWHAKILWEGVLVKDLLGLPDSRDGEAEGLDGPGDPRGKVVKFFAADGYSTSLPLDFVLENDLILAYKMNGVTLPPERGFPFQLVAEDKWGYKWIKWVTRIRVDEDTDFRGFWESRGYRDDADLNGPFSGG
jgi:hypothetical protein